MSLSLSRSLKLFCLLTCFWLSGILDFEDWMSLQTSPAGLFLTLIANFPLQVTWSRRPSAENSLQILSIGDLVHINDPRFLIAKKPQDNVSVEDSMLLYKIFKASLHLLTLWSLMQRFVLLPSLLPWSDVRNNCITSMHTLLFIVFSRSGGQGRAQGIVTMIIGKYL